MEKKICERIKTDQYFSDRFSGLFKKITLVAMNTETHERVCPAWYQSKLDEITA